MADNPTAAPERSNAAARQRRDSENSQTAADFLRDQMQLEADAREALPYSIENCTKQLGNLRQSVFACLTCHPPPANPDSSSTHTPAGVCYACSVQCHGEHELVEIFQKRNFTCDCGTTRFTAEQPCTLRLHPATNTKGNVHSEAADPANKYNQNFRNRFCSCSIDYVAQEQKGTMFQCLGLGTHETGGCGEDWYHPGCLVGLGPRWYEKMTAVPKKKPAAAAAAADALPTISEDGPAPANSNGAGAAATVEDEEDEDDDNDAPLPEGFPGEDDFNHFLCYKCVEAHPWIKRYAGAAGFLLPVYFQRDEPENNSVSLSSDNKRKLEDEEGQASEPKRAKTEEVEDGQSADPALPVRAAPAAVEIGPKEEEAGNNKDLALSSSKPTAPADCKYDTLPPAPTGQFSLFMTEGFRDTFCRCPKCFPLLEPHPQLLDEEEVYEPPLSEGEGSNDGASTHGSGSLYERGESALRNVDRVRAIEGVMAYKHLKDKLTPFFEQFAKSGKAVGADDIKEYFAKLRGDEQAIKEAGAAASNSKGGDGDDQHRPEQSGY
ncbi:hypothetical protein PG999_012406 [Apiospora kogelbergensis]|uniref:UBR-type domain-containing protein n=1 Tax=Apiospora kogelbergensis TaxID=1337665 RepID=A0AAW0Q7Y7_9PEZI